MKKSAPIRRTLLIELTSVVPMLTATLARVWPVAVGMVKSFNRIPLKNAKSVG